MEEYQDNERGGEELEELAGRFEKMIEDGSSSFYDLEDLEELLDHYIGMHQFEKAFQVIETAREQHPYSIGLSIREAELLSLSDRPVEALDILDKVENVEAFNPDFHLTKASILSQIGRYHKAIHYLEKALEFSSDEFDVVYFNLAIEYQNLENFDKAIKYLKKVLKHNPDNDDALYELAYCYEMTGGHRDAIHYFSTFRDYKPYNAHVWYNLGSAYAALGEYKEASLAFEYCLIVDDGFSAAHLGMANALARLGRYEEAIESYKLSLSFEFLDALVYYYIADCYDNLDDPDTAYIYYQKALRKDPKMAEAWLGAGGALEEKGDFMEALAFIRKAIALDPENADYWCFLGEVQMKHFFVEDAVVSFEKAIALNYLFEDLYLDYSHLYLIQGLPELALEVLGRGLHKFPFSTEINLRIATCHYHLGNNEKGYELLVKTVGHNKCTLDDFLEYFPTAANLAEVKYLIETLE